MQIGNITSRYQYVKPMIGNTSQAEGSFSERLGNVAASNTGITVFMKKDDMLYSGCNGTGLSYYLKYADNSTEEDPTILAKGIDENGKEFEQTIRIKDINPKNATIVEMRALEAYTGISKSGRLSSLPNESVNVGLNKRQDFIGAFKKEISDMRVLGEFDLMSFFERNLRMYEAYCTKPL